MFYQIYFVKIQVGQYPYGDCPMNMSDREWMWLIFLLNKNSWLWVIVAHFFWEVIMSDLAHEKSELAQLWC